MWLPFHLHFRRSLSHCWPCQPSGSRKEFSRPNPPSITTQPCSWNAYQKTDINGMFFTSWYLRTNEVRSWMNAWRVHRVGGKEGTRTKIHPTTNHVRRVHSKANKVIENYASESPQPRLNSCTKELSWWEKTNPSLPCSDLLLLIKGLTRFVRHS